MRPLFLGIFTLAVAFCAKTPKDPFTNPSTVEFVKKVQRDFAEYQTKHEEILENYEEDYPFGWKSFDCEVGNGEDPSDVHHLRPEHVKVIGAIGDSLTAGRAANAVNLEEILDDWRGISFAIGGDGDVETTGTLPNIFAKFSPNIVGGSTGKGLSEDENSALNVAVSGSFASDIPEQAIEIVSRIRSRRDVDFESDWKFINIFVGSNDLCKVCRNYSRYGVDEFQSHVIKAISYLRDNLPRTYVNVMPPISVDFLNETHKFSKFCTDYHGLACPCISDLSSADFSRVRQSFTDSLSIFYGDVYQTDTFAVSISPAGTVKRLPRYKTFPNFGIIALDCFHFTAPMHDTVAKFVWRNIFEPIQNRTILNETNYILDRFDCPAKECPYLRTLSNSYNCQVPQKTSGISIEKLRAMPLVDRFPSGKSFIEGTSTIGLLVLGTIFTVLAVCAIVSVLKFHGYRQRKMANEKTPLLKIDLYDEEGIF